MADIILHSYELSDSKKESFADWVSNISPEYTPFTSMIKKFPVSNTRFQWQVDTLSAANTDHSYAEGSDANSVPLTATTTLSGYTQIMRKVVMVSDTANAVSSYGREKELFYQLKKATKELKRDCEFIFLKKHQAGRAHGTAPIGGTGQQPGLTHSLGTMIHPVTIVQSKERSVLWSKVEEDLFELTERLYTEGAEADVIMYNPVFASDIADLQEKGARQRIFENTKDFVKQVEVIVDPLGQEFKCFPNRWMPTDVIYAFSSSDIGMAVLRAPYQVKLCKDGSYEKFMIEQEVGLRLDNHKAAGMITFAADAFSINALAGPITVGGTVTLTVSASAGGTAPTVTWHISDSAIATVDIATGAVTGVKEGTVDITAFDHNTGDYSIVTLTVGPAAPAARTIPAEVKEVAEVKAEPKAKAKKVK